MKLSSVIKRARDIVPEFLQETPGGTMVLISGSNEEGSGIEEYFIARGTSRDHMLQEVRMTLTPEQREHMVIVTEGATLGTLSVSIKPRTRALRQETWYLQGGKVIEGLIVPVKQ